MSFCNNCGSTLKEGAKFCTGCGKQYASPQVVKPIVAPSAAPVQSVIQQAPAVAESAGICKSCKKPVKSKATKFCLHCGVEDPLDLAPRKPSKCENCNYAFDDRDTEFCPNCGKNVASNVATGVASKSREIISKVVTRSPEQSQQSQPVSQQSASRFCNNCGAKMAVGKKFCTACGTPLKP